MFKTTRQCRIELHATGGAPNARPVLKIFQNAPGSDSSSEAQIAEIELSDFSGCAQWFAEGEAKHNLKLEGDRFKSYVKRVREGLGFSYP